MNKQRSALKSILSVFLLAVTVMALFSSCKTARPLSGEAYTITVDSDPSGETAWTVQYDQDGVVSHTVTPRGDGKTDVVFTGLKKGKTTATLYRGGSLSTADDVYVLALLVDRKGNVTESDPRYGAYTVDCDRAVAGAQWRVSCSGDGDVRWYGREKPLSGVQSGVQEYEIAYTGKRPGAVHVTVTNYLPWADITNDVQDFWLYVDREYKVSALEMTDFVSFRLTQMDTSAEYEVYEAVKTDDGAALTYYTATSSWSDEVNDYVETRLQEQTLDGDDAVYRSLAGLLRDCGVSRWDGFSGSNPNVLDGRSFRFEASLADGSRITASGTNKFPDRYGDLYSALHDRMERAKNK